MRRAAADAMEGLEGAQAGFSAGGDDAEPAPSRSGRWRAIEPGEERMPASRPPRVPVLSMSAPATLPTALPRPATVRTPSALARDVRLDAGTGGAAAHEPATLVVRVERAWFARAGAVRALAPEQDGFVSVAVQRHARGRDIDEPLGGAGSPIVRLEGTGVVVLGSSSADRSMTAVRLAEELLYVREDRLIGFDGALRFENGRLPAADGDPTAIVQIGGAGLVVFESRSVGSLDVATGRPVLARAQDVIGWIGRLLPQPIASRDAPGGAHGFVTFNGDGVLLIDG